MENGTLEYGISTAAYDHLSLAKALARIAAFTGLAELRCESRHDVAQARNRRAALAARRDGLRFTMHGPFWKQNIWSSNDARRRRALDDHRRYIDLAAQLGASIYVLHPDYSYFPQPHDPEVVTRLQASFAELAELQAGSGLRIAVENMPGVGHSHFAAPGIATSGLPLVVDVGHGHLSGSLPDLIAQPHIVHWHLHDNLGSGDDDHLAVGSGTVDWEPVIARIRQTMADEGATAVLEVMSEADVVSSLAYLALVERRLAGGA